MFNSQLIIVHKMNCFNCGKTSHFSRNCREIQKFTRCYICNRVCVSTASHFELCSNKDFVSTEINRQQSAHSSTIVGQICLQLPDGVDIFVMDTVQTKMRSSPIFLLQNYSILTKSGGQITYSQLFRKDGRRAHMSICNRNNVTIFSVVFELKKFEVNERIIIRDTKVVEFDRYQLGRATVSKDVHLKIDTVDAFNIRINKFGVHDFLVNAQNGVFYVDPMMAVQAQNIVAAIVCDASNAIRDEAANGEILLYKNQLSFGIFF